MIDFNKVTDFKIGDSYVTEVRLNGTLLWKAPLVQGPDYLGVRNYLKEAIDSDHTLYNGGLGYKNGVRLNSSGVEKEVLHCGHTGFIPITRGQIIRVKHFSRGYSGYQYLHQYDSKFTKAGSIQAADVLYPNDQGIWTYDTSNLIVNLAYIRLTGGRLTEMSVITIDEEIPTDGYYNWFTRRSPDFIDNCDIDANSQLTTGNRFISGYIPVNQTDTVLVHGGPTHQPYVIGDKIMVAYDANKSAIGVTSTNEPGMVAFRNNNNGFEFKIQNQNVNYVRVIGKNAGATSGFIITVNETID